MTTPSEIFEQIDPPKPSLLIIDDEAFNIHLLQQIFGSEYQVYAATNGGEALDLCHTVFPDLVLLDVEMPVMDGYDICTQLKKDKSTAHIPVIFVTSHWDEESELRGLGVGAVDFITKPFNARVIEARVKANVALKFKADALRELTFVDDMTGLYNRRFFEDRIESEFLRSRRTGSFLSLIMIEIDAFKSYVDHYGQEAADQSMSRVAYCIRKCCKRPGDFVARYAHNELVCVLPETSVISAFPFAQLLESEVRALGIEHAYSASSSVMTISVGVVSRTGVELTSVFVEMAKGALQNAIEQGGAKAWCELD